MKRRSFFALLAAALLLTFALFATGVFAETVQASSEGYILRFKDEASAAAAKELMQSMPSLYASDTADETALDPVYEPFDIYKTDNAELVALLEDAGLLEYSEPDIQVQLYGYDYAAEPSYASQWAHTAANIAEAWEYGVYGNGVKIAYIDSGVNMTHADLTENLLPGYNFINNTQDVTDNIGHGTNVAGILCAAANGKGVVGTAHRAKLIPLKVTDSSTFDCSYLATAIFDAVDVFEADIISMSLGYYNSGSTVHRTTQLAVKYALANNVIVVAASGNEGNDATKSGMLSYPASFEGVVSVANLAQSASGSYVAAASSQHNECVTVIAPGTSILTTSRSGGYATNSGTSFSAPYVAAVAALAKSVDRNITPEHFIELLAATADKTPLNGAEHSDYYGYGILDAGKLIRTLVYEKTRGGFISPIDRRTDGTIVRFCNTSAANAAVTLIAKNTSLSQPLGIYCFSRELEAGEIAEAVLPGSTGSASEWSFYLLNSRTFSPLYQVIRDTALLSS